MSDKPIDEQAAVPPIHAVPVVPEPPAASKFRDRLGAILVGGLMVAIGVLFFVAIPDQNVQLITYMLGQLSGFAAAVVAFHYTMNSTNTQATANTGEAFKAIAAAQRGAGGRP